MYEGQRERRIPARDGGADQSRCFGSGALEWQFWSASGIFGFWLQDRGILVWHLEAPAPAVACMRTNRRGACKIQWMPAYSAE